MRSWAEELLQRVTTAANSQVGWQSRIGHVAARSTHPERTDNKEGNAVSTRNLMTAAVVVASLVTIPTLAAAQDTAPGTLTVTATVQSSIGLTFESDGAGVPLGGTGTNAATMALGAISAYNTIPTVGVTRTVSASDFTVSSPFAVRVVKANTISGTYRLAAALDSADTNTWRINAIALVGTASSSLGLTYAYDSPVAHTVYLTVPFTASTG